MRLRISGNREKPIDRILKNILLLNVRLLSLPFRLGTQQTAHAVRQLRAGPRDQKREGARGGHHRIIVCLGHHGSPARSGRDHASSADGRVLKLPRSTQGSGFDNAKAVRAVIVEHLGDNGDDEKAIHDSVVVPAGRSCDVERREGAGGGEVRGGDRLAAARNQRANGVGRGDGRGLLERRGVAAALGGVPRDAAVGADAADGAERPGRGDWIGF